MEPIIRLTAEIRSQVKNKPHNAPFKVVLELLDIIKSMQSETASDQVLQHANDFFKNNLLPLYQSVTELTLQLASVLLEQVIRKARSVQDEESVLLKSMPDSIISGLVGFLEVDKKCTACNCLSDTKALVARYFYEVLSENFFLGSLLPASEFVKVKPATLTAAYQLLYESSFSHSANSSKLRDPTRLGGYRIGLTLAKLSDYLPIEALLDLFANLLPSAKAAGVREKRAQFIEQVFRPELFTNSQDIISLLKKPVPEWSVTSQKISDLIASEMPSFPQAFEAKELYIGHSEVYTTERIYVNGSGFLASIDEGDSLGTIQVPFGQIETLSLSNPTNGKTAVTVMMKAPPIKNQQVMSLSSSQEMGQFRCVWEINANDTRKLMNVLKQRKLDFLVASQRKISIAGSGVAFADNHTSHQSQTDAIASLWSAINPNDRTSPISVPLTSYNKGYTSTPKHDEELCKSKMPIATGPVANSDEVSEGLVSLGSDPEDGLSQVVRKVTRRNRNALLVSSDSESAASIALESDNLPGKNVTAIVEVKSGRQTRSNARPTVASSKTLQSPHVTALGKRKHSDESDSQIKSKTNNLPVKRPRVKRDLGEQDSSSKTKTPKTTKPRTTRIRRIGGSSLSPPSISPEADITERRAPDNNKPTLSRMRNKVGHTHRTKPKQTKLPASKMSDHGINFHDVIEVQSDQEDIDAAKNAVKSRAYKKTTPGSPKKRPQRKNLKRAEHKDTSKHKKAPWNEPAFIARIELSKNDISTSPMQLSEPQENLPHGFDFQVWDTTPPAMAKGATPATSAKEDVQNVDLTMEESLSHQKVETVSHLQNPSVERTTLYSGTIQAKTSAEIGIQVDPYPITPKAHSLAKRPSLRFELVPPKLISRVQPLERSILITTLTPQPKSGPNKHIARPPADLRIQRKPTTSSPRAPPSDKWLKPEAANSRIVNILKEIDDVILGAIESKFEAVRGDWKATHHRMLVSTQEKVQDMHQANVDHYNSLVELYERYTVEHQANLQPFSEMKRSNQEALEKVKEAVLKHNRHSLSKKFPKSMFTSVPPAIRTRRYSSVIS